MRKYLLAMLAASTLSLSAHAEMVANFTFDGSTVESVSGDSATTKFSNGNPINFVTDRHGKEAGAMSFLSTPLLFSQTDATALSQFTVSTWLKFDDNANDQGRHYLFDSRNSSTALMFYDFGNSHRFGTSATGRSEGGLNLNDGEWHYVAVSSDSEQGTTLYLDGQIVGNIDEATTLSLKALTLGNYSNSSTGYDLHGAMDDFQIYDVAMDAQSISQQYARQSSDVGIPLYGMSALLLGGLVLRSRKPQS